MDFLRLGNDGNWPDCAHALLRGRVAAHGWAIDPSTPVPPRPRETAPQAEVGIHGLPVLAALNRVRRHTEHVMWEVGLRRNGRGPGVWWAELPDATSTLK